MSVVKVLCKAALWVSSTELTVPELTDVFGVEPDWDRERSPEAGGLARTHSQIQFSSSGAEAEPDTTVATLLDQFRPNYRQIREFAAREHEMRSGRERASDPVPVELDIGHRQRHLEESYSLSYTTLQLLASYGATYTFSTYADPQPLVKGYIELQSGPGWAQAREAWDAAHHLRDEARRT